MNTIYTITVHMASKVQIMGGRWMAVNVTGERTFYFTNTEEAYRFDEMMRNKGYEVEMGIIRATAEEAAAQVAIAHQKLGSSLGPRVGALDTPLAVEGGAMKRKHKFIIKWQPWANEWEAHSDTMGEDSSPVGVGESPMDALELLIDELEELEKRSEP